MNSDAEKACEERIEKMEGYVGRIKDVVKDAEKEIKEGKKEL